MATKPLADMTISDRAIALILEFEGFSGRVDYPGGASGPTWGIGYDGAYHTAAEIRKDWGPHLSAGTVTRLLTAVGAKGQAAVPVVNRLRDVRIPRSAADAVFRTVDIPRWIQRTATALPGYDTLPDDVQGALVSLVFNRGTRMTDAYARITERLEMRQIRDLVEDRDLPLAEKRTKIAAALRSMSRLWTGKLPAPYNVKLGGLVRRREAEARLVEGA